MGIFRSAIIAFFITVGSMHGTSLAATIDGKWFLHSFGEMRAYFGDFLAVCDEKDFRRCRVVQYGFKSEADLDSSGDGTQDSFFGSSRLSIQQHFDANGGMIYDLDIFSVELPDTPRGPMILSIDGDIFQLSTDDWQAGSPEGYNVAQTFSVVDPLISTQLIAAMRAGNRLRVLHDNWTETHFQLRGITRALDAIKAREFD